MKKVLILSLSTLFLSITTQCGMVGWSDDAKKSFVESCVAKAKVNIDEAKAKKYCDCALEETMKKYDNPIDALGADEAAMESITQACIKTVLEE